MSDSCITKDKFFLSGEEMEENKEKKKKYSDIFLEDLKENSVKYIVHAFIFSILFIGSVFLFGLNYSAGKATGVLIEPVSENVIKNLSPEIQEIKNQTAKNGQGIQELKEYNINKEKKEVREEAIKYISDIKKYYDRIKTDDNKGWTPEHLNKLTNSWPKIPDDMKTDDVVYKYEFDINFLRSKGF